MARNSAVVDVAEPWWAILSTVLVKLTLRAISLNSASPIFKSNTTPLLSQRIHVVETA